MHNEESEIPHNAVIIRFGTGTPYYPLTFSYGLFVDPSTRNFFTSLDHYLGVHMFVRREDRKEVMRAPNGYIAYRNIQAILENSRAYEGEPVVSPTWEADRDNVAREGLRLKYTQSTCLAEMLLRTGDRPIIDASRAEDNYWCFADGQGKNRHGELLEELRSKLRAGDLLPAGEV